MRTPTALSSAACVAAEADSRTTSTAAETDTCYEALPVPAQRNSMLTGTVVSTMQKPVCRRLENERKNKKRKKERKSTDPVPRTRRVLPSRRSETSRVSNMCTAYLTCLQAKWNSISSTNTITSCHAAGTAGLEVHAKNEVRTCGLFRGQQNLTQFAGRQNDTTDGR